MKSNSAFQPIRFAIEEVTPAMAAAWLSGCGPNRSRRRTHVARLRSEMVRGAFALTHQGIAIGPDGKPFDGQHRLQAIVDSGCTVTMVVAYYSDAEVAQRARRTLDRGAKRDLADAIVIANSYDEDTVATMKKRVAVAACTIQTVLDNGSSADVGDDRVSEEVDRAWDDCTSVMGHFSARTHAPAVAAFVFMRPISPVVIDGVAARLSSGIGMSPIEASLAKLVSPIEGKGNTGAAGRGTRLLTIARGIEAILDHENISKVQAPKDRAALIKRLVERVLRARGTSASADASTGADASA